MRRKALLSAIASAAVVAFTIASQGQAPLSAAAKPTNVTQVTTTIDQADPLTSAVYHVTGDAGGGASTYASTSDGLVSSILQVGTTGDWSLDTYVLATVKGKTVVKPSGRVVSFDFSAPAEDNTVPLPFSSTIVSAPAHLIAKCHLDPALTTFVGMQAGQDVECPGAFRFEVGNDASGKTYRLAFQPENYPQVTRMHVHCDTADSGGCAAWTITPGADGAGNALTFADGTRKSRNKLLLIDRSSDAVLADLGDYYMSFGIHIAR